MSSSITSARDACTAAAIRRTPGSAALSGTTSISSAADHGLVAYGQGCRDCGWATSIAVSNGPGRAAVAGCRWHA